MKTYAGLDTLNKKVLVTLYKIIIIVTNEQDSWIISRLQAREKQKITYLICRIIIA